LSFLSNLLDPATLAIFKAIHHLVSLLTLLMS
jgi:hypothetical protein